MTSQRKIQIIITVLLIIGVVMLGYWYSQRDCKAELAKSELEKALKAQALIHQELTGIAAFQPLAAYPALASDQFSVIMQNDQAYISLPLLCGYYGLAYDYDSFEGIASFYNRDNQYYLLKEAPVIAKNGIMLANKDLPYINDEDEVFISLDTLYNLFNYRSQLDPVNLKAKVYPAYDYRSASRNLYLAFEQDFPSYTADDLVDYLSFLAKPIEGASVTTRDSQMPGAPRPYRNGTHEGLDWYFGDKGVLVTRSTPILSIADGLVVRADHDYVEYTEHDRNETLNFAATLPYTPQYILDGLRGMTVWVQYDNGVMARYAHMTSIDEQVQVGSKVSQGQVLGYVGNSGTSYGIDGNDLGLHLHLDLLIYNRVFWEHLTTQEIRIVLETIFPR